MASTEHTEQVANERANVEIYLKFLESSQRPDLSTISVSASSHITQSGLPTIEKLPSGDVIGRVQLANGANGVDVTNLYIGPRRARLNDLKFRETDEHRFEVFSWAAPVASVFYTGHYSSGQDVEIEAAIVRSLICESKRVIDFEDDVYAEPIQPVFPVAKLSIPAPPVAPKLNLGPQIDTNMAQAISAAPIVPKRSIDESENPNPEFKENLLQRVRGAKVLQTELRKPRREELSALLQTLQARQYELISQPGTDDLVLQGNPGTGKTIVAAHRVAYLLNPESGINGFPDGKVMLIGPSKAYATHVRKILIDLDSDPNRYIVTSIEEIFGGLLKGTSLKTFIPNTLPSANAGYDNLLNYDRELYEIAEITAYRFEDYYEELYLKSLQRSDRKHPAKPKLSELSDGRKLQYCFDFFKEPGKSRELIQEAIEKLMEVDDDTTPEEIAEYVKNRADRWENWVLNLPEYDDLSGQADHQWFMAALSWHLDQTTNDTYTNIAHVVIDEAQDIYPVEWEFLKVLNPRSNWTLVGDFNQQSAMHSSSTWKVLCKQLGIKSSIQYLDTGFRSTSAIMALANSVVGNTQEGFHSLQMNQDLPVSVRVRKPQLIVAALKQIELLAAKYEDGLLALIVPPSLIAHFNSELPELGWRHQSDSYKWINPSKPWSQKLPLAVATPVELRGLEYDGVVLVETADFPSKKQLYMGITRANKELRLIDSKGLPPAIHKWVREQE